MLSKATPAEAKLLFQKVQKNVNTRWQLAKKIHPPKRHNEPLDEIPGMVLRTPLVPSASPLSNGLDNVRRMEDAGAAAIVFHSLFEEHVIQGQNELQQHLTHGTDSYAEALTYAPDLGRSGGY